MQSVKEKRSEFQRRYDEFDEQLPKFCQNCKSRNDLTIHHIVPLVLGGNNVIGNMARLCNECHGKIHGKKSVHHKELQRKGIEEAKKRGAFKGGKARLTIDKEQVQEAIILYHQRKEKKITVDQIMKRTGIARATIYRLIKMYPIEDTPELQVILRQKRVV